MSRPWGVCTASQYQTCSACTAIFDPGETIDTYPWTYRSWSKLLLLVYTGLYRERFSLVETRATLLVWLLDVSQLYHSAFRVLPCIIISFWCFNQLASIAIANLIKKVYMLPPDRDLKWSCFKPRWIKSIPDLDPLISPLKVSQRWDPQATPLFLTSLSQRVTLHLKAIAWPVGWGLCQNSLNQRVSHAGILPHARGITSREWNHAYWGAKASQPIHPGIEWNQGENAPRIGRDTEPCREWEERAGSEVWTGTQDYVGEGWELYRRCEWASTKELSLRTGTHAGHKGWTGAARWDLGG